MSPARGDPHEPDERDRRHAAIHAGEALELDAQHSVRLIGKQVEERSDHGVRSARPNEPTREVSDEHEKRNEAQKEVKCHRRRGRKRVVIVKPFNQPPQRAHDAMMSLRASRQTGREPRCDFRHGRRDAITKDVIEQGDVERAQEMWQRSDVRRLLAFTGVAVFAASALVVACGHSNSNEADDASTDAFTIDRARLPATVTINVDASTPDGSACVVTIASPPLEPGVHVAVGTPITWDSNPPSSGTHYPIWAAYQEFVNPVPRGFYVHDLEHGAIDLLYNCAGDAGDADGGACPDVVDGLRAVSAAIPDDPLCTSANEGVRVRTVMTPDPLIPTRVAAAAWGWTYTADCIDVPTLTAFALAHYGQGTEFFCTNGQTNFSIAQ